MASTRSSGIDDRMGRTLAAHTAEPSGSPALAAVPPPTTAKPTVRFTSDLPEDLDDFLTVFARRARGFVGRSVRKVQVVRTLLELFRFDKDLQTRVLEAMREGVGRPLS